MSIKGLHDADSLAGVWPCGELQQQGARAGGAQPNGRAPGLLLQGSHQRPAEVLKKRLSCTVAICQPILQAAGGARGARAARAWF